MDGRSRSYLREECNLKNVWDPKDSGMDPEEVNFMEFDKAA